MGTSSARSGDNALRGGAWSRARGNVTSLMRGTGTSVGSAVASFASALGGSTAARNGGNAGSGGGARPLSSSVKTGQKLGTFLGGVGSRGLDQTLRSIGLENLIGATPYAVLSGVVDYISGNGSLLDEAIARSATVEVLAEIFDESDDTYSELRDRWDGQLNAGLVEELMALFITQSIFQRFLADLGERIESNAISVRHAEKCEKDVLEFIRAMVEFELGETNPFDLEWQGPEGEVLIQRNLSAALAQLEFYS